MRRQSHACLTHGPSFLPSFLPFLSPSFQPITQSSLSEVVQEEYSEFIQSLPYRDLIQVRT